MKYFNVIIVFATVLLLALPAAALSESDVQSFLYFLSFLLGALVIIAIVILILREVVCWYFKINIRAALLTEIRDLLAKGATGHSQQSEPSPGLPEGSDSSTCVICSKCGAVFESSMRGKYCDNCGSLL
jgi:hypothetical protein